jgi:pimeloyl-ACP methyl ester carboxylesterase
MEYEGVSIAYYTEGNPEKEAIVLLHPAFSDYRIFQYQFEAWKDQYYMIAVDMVSHGQSKEIKNGVNMGHMPKIVNGIMQSLDVKKAHVIGVSLGSLVAQGFADAFPERVKSVTVVGGYSIHKENKAIMKTQQKEMGKWILYFLFSMKKFKKYIVDSSAYSDQCRRVFEKTVSTFRRRDFVGMNGMDQIFVDKEDTLAYPLLVVCGRHDLQVAREFGKRWEEIEEKATYVEIEEAGHCVNIDAPKEFNRIWEEKMKDSN